jgi:hypothetical protein
VTDWLEFAAGVTVALVVLADLFATLLVPGPVAGRLSILLHIRKASLPVWRRAAERRDGEDPRPSNVFAPFTFLLTFTAWMLMLLVAYGLMLHATAHLFQPRLEGFGDALWIAGCSLLTLGVSEYDADGIARWIILSAALSGFSALTAAITFMLQVQTGLHQREPEVLTLTGLAGVPPSGIVLLETLMALDAEPQLASFFLKWRDWSAATLHSHLAYPVLSYFRSVDTENDWLAALEAVLDAATLVAACTTDRAAGSAVLLHRTGARTASRLRRMFRLLPAVTTVEAVGVRDLVARLERAGFGIADGDPVERFLRMRADYAGDITALARYLGGNRAELVPGET